MSCDNKITKMMEVLDENKESLSNDTYLKLCNGLKQLYTTKVKQYYLFTYINCKINKYIINENSNKYDVFNIRPMINRKVAYTDYTEEQLNHLIKSSTCRVKNEIKFINVKGAVKLIEKDFSAEKKDNLQILYNQYTLIGYQKVDIDEEVMEENSDAEDEDCDEDDET